MMKLPRLMQKICHPRAAAQLRQTAGIRQSKPKVCLHTWIPDVNAKFSLLSSFASGMMIVVVIAILTSPAMAEEYLFAPDICEFQVTLPSEPQSAKRCKPDAPADCHNITSFTHVFGLDATVDVRLTCNKAEPQMFERYSGDVMRATLEGMVGKNRLDEYESYYKEYENAKQAVLIGSGDSANSNKIYMAQLWIGQESVFTIEGELIGGPHEEADDMFAKILQSATLKEDVPEEENTDGGSDDDEDESEDDSDQDEEKDE